MTRPWRTFVMISIGVFASVLDLFIVNIAFPDLQRDFAGTGLAELSWVLNGYAIVFAALLVPAGRLADLYGRSEALWQACRCSYSRQLSAPQPRRQPS